jgi:hypothetical protein
LIEALKDVRALFRRDAAAVITDCDQEVIGMVRRPCDIDPDLAAGRGKLDGVAQ